ncbi:ParA family protein [Jatrophihabitans telluris]|uniref:ParA family protein n=1 Tax=Jatrophihabitans telluris TaxID=2038343 RepID=A0ABY4QZ82_9ACTN|nr:ParA family protein [Jatrophihabitans telluris]UQX88724.1 ParA family protein [Jatrophihabitans telluris]
MKIALCSSKGGVGKTATAANLAAVFADSGARVLAVDADPQESLGRAFGVVAGAEDSLAAILDPDEPAGLDTAIRRDVIPGLDVLPSHPSLEQRGITLAQQGGLVSSLRRALRPVRDRYDHIVIDTHGDTGNLTLAAVAAADAVLTVFTSDPGSALGAVRIAGFVNQHRTFENTEAVLLGAICANWDASGAAARDVAAALESTDLPLFATRIPQSRRVPSATLAKRPVVLSAPNSSVALAYRALGEEILLRASELGTARPVRKRKPIPRTA